MMPAPLQTADSGALAATARDALARFVATLSEHLADDIAMCKQRLRKSGIEPARVGARRGHRDRWHITPALLMAEPRLAAYVSGKDNRCAIEEAMLHILAEQRSDDAGKIVWCIRSVIGPAAFPDLSPDRPIADSRYRRRVRDLLSPPKSKAN